MNSEEMSRLWSALQAHYRPTAAFQVSVVLIQPQRPATSPLPVLTRGRFVPATSREEGVFVTPGLVPPYPTLESAAGRCARNAVDAAGSAMRSRCAATTWPARNARLLMRNDRFGVEHEIAVADGTDEADFSFDVPVLPAALPVGVYRVELRVLRPGEAAAAHQQPAAGGAGARDHHVPADRDGAQRRQSAEPSRIGCQPEARVGQKVVLLMDTREAPAQPFNANSAATGFRIRAMRRRRAARRCCD